MNSKGSEFYDNDDNFNNYMERRQWEENANDTLEKPVILDLMGEVKGKRVLDLGCGDAKFGREILHKGCTQYIGIDGSVNMIQAARKNLEGTGGQVIHTAIETWEESECSFNLAISRLVLHYLEDIEQTFSQISSNDRRLLHGDAESRIHR
jgi:ubiquinone/menaquinone biosynthesis C-methylase UbiE